MNKCDYSDVMKIVQQWDYLGHIHKLLTKNMREYYTVLWKVKNMEY